MSIAPALPTLDLVINADVKKNTVTVKNSCSRNLHRLASALLFIKLLLERLMSDPGTTLKDAAGFAYEEALAPIHTVVVKAAVRTGLLTLPTRQQFLEHINETEDSAKEHAGQFVKVAGELVARVYQLYPGPMPASTNWFIST